jgi:hypothetical protein
LYDLAMRFKRLPDEMAPIRHPLLIHPGEQFNFVTGKVDADKTPTGSCLPFGSPGLSHILFLL